MIKFWKKIIQNFKTAKLKENKINSTWNISRVVMNFEIWEVGSNWITRTIANFAIKAVRDHQTQNFLKVLKRGQALKFWGGGVGQTIHYWQILFMPRVSILLERSFASPADHTYPYHNGQWVTSKKVIKDFVGLNQRATSSSMLMYGDHEVLLVLVYKWAKRLPTDIFARAKIHDSIMARLILMIRLPLDSWLWAAHTEPKQKINIIILLFT